MDRYIDRFRKWEESQESKYIITPENDTISSKNQNASQKYKEYRSNQSKGNRGVRFLKQLVLGITVFIIGSLTVGLSVYLFAYQPLIDDYQSVKEPSIFERYATGRWFAGFQRGEEEEGITFYYFQGKHFELDNPITDVHTSPETDSPILLKLFQGVVVEIINQKLNKKNPDDLENRWYKIQTEEGYQGWVTAISGKLTEKRLTPGNALEKKQKTAAKPYFDRAQESLANGNYELAKIDLEAAMQLYPNYAEARESLSNLNEGLYYESFTNEYLPADNSESPNSQEPGDADYNLVDSLVETYEEVPRASNGEAYGTQDRDRDARENQGLWDQEEYTNQDTDAEANHEIDPYKHSELPPHNEALLTPPNVQDEYPFLDDAEEPVNFEPYAEPIEKEYDHQVSKKNTMSPEDKAAVDRQIDQILDDLLKDTN